LPYRLLFFRRRLFNAGRLIVEPLRVIIAAELAVAEA
jgi:hypothetical protein